MSAEDFRRELQRLMALRGWKAPRVAKIAGYTRTYVWEIKEGRKKPSLQFVQDIDTTFGANGYLVTLFDAAPGDVPVEAMVTLEQVALAAAHESTTRAAESGAQQIAASSVEQVQADVERLTREFSSMAPLDALLEARRLRDFAIDLVERTRKPGHISDLYLAAGLSCSLLSVASFDLAIWPAAAEQARAAYLYGELVDHWSLRSWARGQEALVAYWAGRSDDAARLAHAGLELAPPGTPRARVLSIAARAWSCLGSAEQAIEMLHAAERERDLIGDHGTDELHDGLSGQFGWGPARQAMCSASAWLGLGNADQAVRQATLALNASSIDHTGTQVATKARADLAAAHLEQGRLDAATDALGSVWTVAPAHRRHALTSRLHDVAVKLNGQTYRSAVEAKELRERIETFTRESTALKELASPRPPGGALPSPG